jgi:hypothetical protein
MTKSKKNIPFEFVIENLFSADPIVKPMFGCHSIYIDGKIVLSLRDKDDDDSGVWIGTSKEFHSSLKKEFPSMRSIRIFGPGTSGWQVLPKDADDFETSVNKVCELILKGDERIGKIPKVTKKKKGL